MTTQPLIPRGIPSLLVELPSWVGDAVMATPVLRAARRAFPEARITGLMRPGIDSVLEGCPYLDAVVVVSSRGFKGVLAAARAVRRVRPAAALLLPNSFRAALGVRLGGVPIRAGYSRDGRGWLLNRRIVHAAPRVPIPAIDYYAALAESAFGGPITDRSVQLWVTRDEELAADRLLEGVAGPFIVFNPGANRPDKRWPIERFAQTAQALHSKRGVAIVVNGSPSERALAGELCRQCDGAIDLAARGVTLGSLKAVLQRARLLITNDTGPRHVAAAVGTPAVALFGPTDHRWTTLPTARERLLLAEPFLPEEHTANDAATLCALERIPVSDVVRASLELLDMQSSAAPCS